MADERDPSRLSTAAPEAASPGYRSFVSPGHPLVRALFPGPLPARSLGGAAALEQALAAARARVRYDPRPGRRDLDALLAQVAAAPPDGRVDLNCINFACALVSCLRAAGFGSDEVYVLLGGRQSAIRASPGAEFHAWVVVLLDGELVTVDPADIRPVRTTGEELLAGLRIFALFNDAEVHFLDADQRQVLLRRERGSGLRLYLFGRPERVLREAIGDPAFRGVVRTLFGQSPAGDGAAPAPERLEAWIGAGLLSREGETLAPGRKLLLVPRGPERDLHALAGPAMDLYLGLLSAWVPRLSQAFSRCAAAARWDWPEVAAAVVGGMLIDLAVGREMEIEARVRRERGDNVVWAFENVSALHSIGVLWTEAPSGDWAVGQIWHPAVRQRPVRLDARMVEELGLLAGGEPVPASPQRVYLQYQKMIARAGDGWRVEIPAFSHRETGSLLGPLLAEGGRRLVREAILPAIARAEEHPWWGRARQEDSYRHAILRLMVDYGIDRAFQAGFVAAPAAAAGVPFSWGRWLWLGQRGDALPRSLGAAPQTREAAAVAPA